MKFFELLMVPFIIISLFTLCSTHLCPSPCPCETKTIICETCLLTYYQTYNLSTHACNCLPGFRKFKGGGDICCPQNCKLCYYKGCAECKPHALLEWNNTYKYLQCKCDINYYQSGNDCLCLSNRLPERFYLNPETTICYACPEGCTCTSQGCVQCDQNSNRYVKRSLNNLTVCSCQYPFAQNNGACVCPVDCRCQNNILTDCAPQSNRFYSYKTWSCSPPYKQINGSCHCLQPYALIDMFGQLKCLCKSKINFTQYHQSSGECRPCGLGCLCTIRGCQSCVSQLRVMSDFRGRCHITAKEVNNQCVCVDPYYNDGSQICKCLSKMYPDQYYSRDDMAAIGYCYACPKNCKCDQTGCYWCDNTTMRNVYTSTDVLFYYCECKIGTIESEGKCVCNKQNYFNNETLQCECINKLHPSLAYKSYLCLLCPELCKCDQTGCYECHPSSLRTVKLQTVYNAQDNTNRSVFVCDCTKHLQNNPINITCQCLPSAFYNQTSQMCDCIFPYQTNHGRYPSHCWCKSHKDPQNFYVDLLTVQCQICPRGCSCNQRGCYDCEKYTMRFVQAFYSSLHRYDVFHCPCYQNSFEINGDCTVCGNGSYFNGEGCTKCLGCETCNAYGCLSCREDMILSNRVCVCMDQSLINIDGICSCQIGYYLHEIIGETYKICVKCPSYCLSCRQLNSVISCLSCNTIDTHRKNISENNCPCVDGYSEHKDIKDYCCNLYCGDCDKNGCTICPLYSFRTLSNGECKCLSPYREIPLNYTSILSNTSMQFQMVCGCPQGTYYQNQSCIPCPSNCHTCFYNSKIDSIICTQCVPNSNRDFLSSSCQCLSGFIQSVPMQYYCYDKWCQNIEVNCTKCIQGKILNVEKRCSCGVGQFEEKSKCFPCFLQGCLECTSRSTCLVCNQSARYYLLNNICLYSSLYEYLFSQTSLNKFVLQIKLPSAVQFTNISAAIYQPNLSTSSSSSSQIPIPLTTQSFLLTSNNILVVKLSNPVEQFSNIIVSLFLTTQTTTINYQVISAQFAQLISQPTIGTYSNSQNFYFFYRQITIIYIIAALLLAVSGYKHNQTMFFLQTVTLMGYYLNTQQYKTTLSLHNLSYSYLKFNQGTLSSLLPENYLESSEGNFKFVEMDSNVLRMTEILIIVQTVTVVLFVMIRVGNNLLIHIMKGNYIYSNFKRRLFRYIEFMFKNCMYPLMFFSINTLVNRDCIVFVNKQFKRWSIAASVLIIIVHVLLVTYLYLKGRLSYINKFEYLSALIFSIITPFLMIYSMRVNVLWVILISIIFITKDLSYLFFKRKFSEIIPSNEKILSQSVFSLQFIGIVVQVIVPILMGLDLSIGTIVMVFVTLTVQLAIQIVVLARGKKESDMDKIGILSNNKRNGKRNRKDGAHSSVAFEIQF